MPRPREPRQEQQVPVKLLGQDPRNDQIQLTLATLQMPSIFPYDLPNLGRLA